MAEPIGLASGLLTLAAFAFQSSNTLYNTIKSFQSHNKRVRDLIEELEALSDVLGPLNETLRATVDVDLSTLELPLLRCGNACKEFEQELFKCSSRSGGSRTSFRDWAKLRYMGDDIDEFRRVLAGYKLTISIALTDANLRKNSVTAESLAGYKALIETATDDLQTHLQSIDEKLETIFKQSVTESDSDAMELKLIKEERLSTQKCLQICEQLSNHIDQIQLTTNRGGSSPGPIDTDPVPERVTSEGLQECKNSLVLTVKRLESHMSNLVDRMVMKSRTAMTSEDDLADLARLKEEWQTARQCIDICSQADSHLKENISKIDNYATGDAVQFMVSTNDKILHGKNRGLGWRSRQVGGHMSDTALIHVSQDMLRPSFQNTQHDGASSRANSVSNPSNTAENSQNSEFRERYGRGIRLTSKPPPDTTIFPTRTEENGQNRSLSQ